MNVRNLTELRPFQPRSFLPERIDLAKKENVTAWLQRLLDRVIDSADQFERFVLDRSEVEAAIAQQQSILYIEMTCHTDQPEIAEAYKKFIEQVVPAARPLEDQLDRKCIDLNQKFPLDAHRYGVYFRAMETDVSLFRSENVPLQTQEALLKQEYQKVIGGMVVQFDGKDFPVPQMLRFLMEPNRAVRQGAWDATAGAYAAKADTLDDIFDQMIHLRHQIALNAGFASYREYKFKEYHRFDYTPADCRAFHQAIQRHIVPLQREILGRRAADMALLGLRPWDLEADPRGLPPLKPANDLVQFVNGIQQMFTGVLPEFGEQFRSMLEHGLLDLESRRGKAPGGYQSTLYESRLPFIFMNAIGANTDLRTLTHEGGHAFHALACAHDDLFAYRHAPMEFCEVASMSMELLSAAFLDRFYDPSQQKRWWRDTFERIVRLLVHIAIVDAFQHWLYDNPSHTRRQRRQQWLELNRQFGSDAVDWSGLEQIQAAWWHRVLHFYEVPFYYIEYGIAQVGALGVWSRARQDYSRVVLDYKQALVLGGSRPLPQLFKAAGLSFDFSEKTIQPIAQLLQDQWKASL
ncbi:MAG: M3 family oligoendopeptidase [Planctomycetaceae bacterium]|nr:M3 family oligoendopeptidase [Planctomycetaceae bacterium]